MKDQSTLDPLPAGATRLQEIEKYEADVLSRR